MKKKIFGITLAVALIVLSIAGTSLAYFSDTEVATNTFTSGEGIKITLTYNNGQEDKVLDGTALEVKDENVFPAQTFTRKATITNKANEAYVGAIITITNENDSLSKIVTVDGNKVADGSENTVAVASLFTGLTGYTVKAAETTKGYIVYVLKTDALGKDASATIFKEIVIPAAWGNDEMKVFDKTKIEVTAYAVQTVGFDGANAATTALTTAFEPAWKNFATASALS